MAKCDNCGKEINFTHVCKGCDGRFCTKCKSKSAHDCSGAETDHEEDRSITFSRNKITLGGRERGLTLRDNDRSLDRHDDHEEHEHRHDYRDYHEEPAHTEEHHDHRESRGKWSRDRPHWEYSGPGGANLKVIARFVVLAFIVILLSGAGPFHNDAIATTGHTMWDGIMNLTSSLPDNNSVNITVNTP